jgi:hypothetical protein
MLLQNTSKWKMLLLDIMDNHLRKSYLHFNKWMTSINPTKISYGSFGFVGNALIFHKTTGKPLIFNSKTLL